MNILCKQKQKYNLCDETPSDCHFEQKSFPTGTTVHNNDANINYLIYCQSGHARISSTLFHDEILCEGEIMFVPRQCECTGTALSGVTLLVHKFNNTVCCSEKCILSFLYSHRHIDSKIYCCKLIAPSSLQTLMNGVSSYINDEKHDLHIWHLKHKELIWLFTRYFTPEELRSFFHPMTDEQVPFKNLVLTHYRKANSTEELADLCGYGIHTFRRVFKSEFGTPVYRWLIQKRAEHIKFRLAQEYIPLVDIIDEFNFSTPANLSNFCRKYLGDSPSNLRKKMQAK